MEAKNTARQLLMQLLSEIKSEGHFTVSRVCIKAGMNPSVVSRWKAREIEPRLSTIERLRQAHEDLKAEREHALREL